MRGSHTPARRRRPMSRRRKVLLGAAVAALVAGGVLGYFAAFPDQAPAIVQQAMAKVGLPVATPPPPPTCPLTGVEAPHGRVPQRPVLAVKVENLPEARPQAGLQSADIVVEEPVEGGITRFIALFQCHEVDRVGPVRSARTTDPGVLAQFGKPILAFSGGATEVLRAVDAANLVPIDETRGGAAFTRDDARAAPHDLYVDLRTVYRVAHDGRRPPEPLFIYADEIAGRSRKVSSIHLPFSSANADVYWAWDRREGEWRRSHGEVPHVDESGEQISATNVVVQVVDVTQSGIVDAAGNHSPDVHLTGSGKAYVLRDGRVVVGRWHRRTLEDPTTFVAKDRTEIALAPGRTWIELVPSTVPISFA